MYRVGVCGRGDRVVLCMCLGLSCVDICLVGEICLCEVGLGFGECFEAGLILLGLLVEQVCSGFYCVAFVVCVSERWLCAFLAGLTCMCLM